VTPPVQADLLRLVDGADKQTYLNCEKFYVGEVDLDIANNDEALVENAVEDVDEPVSARRGYQVCQAVVSVRLVAVLA
jgi:hypothetical protein